MPPHTSSDRTGRAGGALPRATPAEQLRIAAAVVLPALAGGVIKRRPAGTALAERFQLDRYGIRTLARLRRTYGEGPLLLSPAGRPVALLLTPESLRRVLAETPAPFTPASWEKRGALSQFQPHGSLITRGPARDARRRANEQALEQDRPLHRLAPAITAAVRDEAGILAGGTAARGRLGWDDFADSWWRTVRRTVLGEAARDDVELTDQLGRLRAAGNWSVLLPRRRRLRARFLGRIRDLAGAAGPGTLAEAVAALPGEPEPGTSGEEAAGQVPHWLFAFDAAGITAMRTLALLATHPDAMARAREETAGGGPDRPRLLPFLRACALEAVRLWPTTPLLLRQGTTDTRWQGQTVPRRTTFLAHTPYFHRAEPETPYADRFDPDIWLDGRAAANPALVPFSAGPGVCPGENVVLLHVSTWLAAMLPDHDYRLVSRVRPAPDRPLPATLDHFALRFAVR
ncbi:cytochrome P450 [Streptomyces lycii]|uniref:Cytochrome P450 n=1 Tax=Streptomyces lycii TaxID=2654337 RepID=A0ABQ7FEF6_9ACTN|nr:cytochrome P450 [Streptomyces lycii]KAF4407205.1 cytochrome P450 [Streptomyces lycii]